MLRLVRLLGSGEFGDVRKALWTESESNRVLEVAVKTLKENAAMEERVKFLQEAAVMGQFYHQNVVQLHGVVLEHDTTVSY